MNWFHCKEEDRQKLNESQNIALAGMIMQALEIKTEDTQLVEHEKLRKMTMSELIKLVKENIKEDI